MHLVVFEHANFLVRNIKNCYVYCEKLLSSMESGPPYIRPPPPPHPRAILNFFILRYFKKRLTPDVLFSNSFIIHHEKAKKITAVTVVWICVSNYHKILPT